MGGRLTGESRKPVRARQVVNAQVCTTSHACASALYAGAIRSLPADCRRVARLSEPRMATHSKTGRGDAGQRYCASRVGTVSGETGLVSTLPVTVPIAVSTAVEDAGAAVDAQNRPPHRPRSPVSR